MISLAIFILFCGMSFILHTKSQILQSDDRPQDDRRVFTASSTADLSDHPRGSIEMKPDESPFEMKQRMRLERHKEFIVKRS